VPQDINPDSSVKSAPTGGESLKVDKPPSPQAERTTPDTLKQSNLKGVRGSPSAGGAPTSPSRVAPIQDPADTSSMSEPIESSRTSPSSSRSHGLRAVNGPQFGKGSSVPQREKVL
jgi:hypothetical protein